MRSMRTIFAITGLLLISVIAVFAQVTNDYRSAGSGNWNAIASWQKYNGAAWIAATVTPDSSVGKIEILANHTITITANVVVDSVFVDSLATLVVSASDTVTVGPPVTRSMLTGITVAGGGSMIVNGVYKHARDYGSLPKATWATGSTCLISLGSVLMDTVPKNLDQSYYNFEWNCPTQTGNLNMNMTGVNDTIKGNFTVRATGASGRIYLTSPGSAGSPQIYTAPITIKGDMIQYNGQFGPHGTSNALQGGLTNYQINVLGNLTVNGSGTSTSWWSMQRGSVGPVYWYVYGNVTFSSCSLTTSNNNAKIVFAKSGTQTLTLSNATIGSSSAFSYEVANGSTLDIGTNILSGTGVLVVDSGGSLKATYGTSNGSVTCTGTNSTLYNNYAIATGTAGSGTVTITASTPANSHLSDTTTALRRYWTVTADAGITSAGLQFSYDPADIPGTATETNFVPMWYTGTGTVWAPKGLVTNATTHVAATNAGININGVWTVGEIQTLIGVKSQTTSTIPKSFFVNQNYPNPFNPSTIITYGIPKASYVTVTVYNLLGQQVATLFSGHQEAGTYPVTFKADHLSSGVYLCRIEAGQSVDVKRMILMK
ncbi:MAG: T9SS type A sorting domain-containing protein [Bacteroidota bacterium]